MTYDVIKISGVPEITTPSESTDIVLGDGNYLKRIKYNTVKNDMVGTSPSYTTDTEPYLMRQTAHTGVVGKCALNKLVGGSLGWNQILSQSGLSGGTVGGITLVKNANGSVTLTGARTGENVNFNVDYVANTIKYQTGHVYYLSWSGTNGIGLQIIMESDVGADSLNKNRLIKVAATASTRSWARIRIGTPMNTNIGTVTYFPQILDITQMFGATIADYAANLENTYGTGIAWLSKYINIGTYHAYDAGSIQSVQATAHVTTGFNQWDETWEMGEIYASTGEEASSTTTWRTKSYIPVIGGTQYYLHCAGHSGSGSRPRFYDGSKNYIGYTPKTGDAKFGTIFTVPDNCVYMRFCPFISEIPMGSPVTLNISKPTGTPKNGDYVPYNGHNYTLGSDTLRGYPMLVNNKLAFDGDEKTPDGTINRKYGYVDMGSLTWTYNNASGHERFIASVTPQPRFVANNVAFNGVCAKYEVVSNGSVYDHAKDKIIGINDAHQLAVYDSAYTNAATFKTAMSGVYLVYPLATESTESSTSYQKIQTIDADGTESFTTSSPVPVGHETQTPDNVLAALGWLGE